MMNLLGLALLSPTVCHCLRIALVLLTYLMLMLETEVCVGINVFEEFLVISVMNLLKNCNFLWCVII